MDSLLGTLLSFTLLFPVLMLGIDLYGVQNIQVYLETKATTISYQISDQGGIRQTLVESLASENITISCLNICQNISIGEVLSYELTMEYTPIIISSEVIHIIVTRSVMIGYL